MSTAAIAYAAAGSPVRRLHLERVTARKAPGQPVELEAQTAVNVVPVTLSLRGEPPGDGHAHGPWHITLLGEAGALSLRMEGSIADPSDWRQGEYRLVLQGRHLVARIGIEDGVASSDDLLVDTRRITIAAAGTLDLESEELDLLFAPRPKRAGLVNPGYLLFTFTQTGSRQANPCAAAVEAAMAMKGTRDEAGNIPSAAPARFSLLPGCTRSRQRPTQR